MLRQLTNEEKHKKKTKQQWNQFTKVTCVKLVK